MCRFRSSPGPLKGFPPVDRLHGDIKQDEIGDCPLHKIQRLFPAVGYQDMVTFLGEDSLQTVHDEFVIIHQKYGTVHNPPPPTDGNDLQYRRQAIYIVCEDLILIGYIF